MPRRKRVPTGASPAPEFGVVYTTDEVAALLKVTRETVQDWLKSGRLRGFRAGRQWRVRQSALEDFVRETE
jgi:excisionase family DNA binding protein